uniref:Uncharacterized protein n=1 Tax=Pongo abelii TaxID=9601 RepID=A0A8I5TMK6_PONAB
MTGPALPFARERRSPTGQDELPGRPAAAEAPATPRLPGGQQHGASGQPTDHPCAGHRLGAPSQRPLPPIVLAGGPQPAVGGAEDKLHRPRWPLSWTPDAGPDEGRHLQAHLRHRGLLEEEGTGKLLPICGGCFHHHQQGPEVPRAPAAEPLVLHHLPRELEQRLAAGGCLPFPTRWLRPPSPQQSGLRAHQGALAHHFLGNSWPPGESHWAAVTQVSIKSVPAPAKLSIRWDNSGVKTGSTARHCLSPR